MLQVALAAASVFCRITERDTHGIVYRGFQFAILDFALSPIRTHDCVWV
jgi:hypothetical protein